MENNQSENYDVICIGSGMGSLTTASFLAQYSNKKVLIIEKHFQAGGYTHSFARKQGKYHWDVGIHYIGDMQEGGFCRQLMDKVSNKNVQWKQMPEPFEKFIFPTRTFSLYGDEGKFKSDLIEQFPSEKESIEKYFEDIRKVSAVFGKSMMIKFSTPGLKAMTAPLKDDSIITLKDYMDKSFQDEELKAILCSQWGDYGLPPSKTSFATHAALVVHYLKGGFYPIGGAGKIFDSIEPIVKSKGGDVLTSTEVTEILIRDGKAVGVKTKRLRGEKEEKEYYAPIIVSGTGAMITYTRLIPESVSIDFREKLKNFYSREKMATSVCVYVGLSDSPAKLGFKGENHWIFGSYDHDKNFGERNEWLKEGVEVQNLYVSFPSLKDPEAKNHTADFIAFTDYENFARWKDLPWKKRGEEYQKFKDLIAEKVVSAIDKRYPGFRGIIDYIEVSTPITNEHFTSHVDGAIYGLACTPERYEKESCPWFEAKTPIPGLFLTGADAGGSPGIAGALMGGLAATLNIEGNREILKKILKD
ncbi:MAG: NAD(P)/FAD-dependent oxidoreductase [Leptospiraceae bacterium]|nr:NAD(P)/FAD-dependent oxidoreductase [Leptospiraceae bacterium]